ncbi:hypothetical protein Arub01_36480 [Actinomadura rubrobrunea]|uniref:N-acetyltransferase domain-containing protein n=1 Tax=Actinomadura rubrobrunea TaxID=115335 RepID=A0A9W6UVS7_9ACTN|nr:GNAT family N-acetyltransferase [Actinomadura rubrobrunea]GLW65404.1 hypothetical protein Arub01_36480 [Actinomadura rubrobrunea]
MGHSFRLRPASPDDLHTIIELIESAAAWLRTKGTTQWNRPWPTRRDRDRRIRTALARGETWILWHGTVPAATVTVTTTPDEALWTPDERAEPAVYLHRLVVDRRYAGLGLGAWLLDWAGWRARTEYGARWIRIDVWADNYALHRYYLRQGFRRLRHSTAIPGYPAGELFQRDTRLSPPRELPRPSVRLEGEPAAPAPRRRRATNGCTNWIGFDRPSASSAS